MSQDRDEANHVSALEQTTKKWTPVFRKNIAETEEYGADRDST
jgi:hypothetical protein